MGTKDEKKRKGMGKGNKALDELTAGFLPSELIIIGGRPAIGKTTLCLDIAQTAAKREDKPVAIFSMEMTKEELVSRMLCFEGKVDESRLKESSLKGSDWQRLTKAANSLSEVPIFIDDTPALSVTEIREKAERLNTDISGGIGMLVIDSLQLIKRPENEEGISEVMKGLKSLARELAVPVIVTSQLGRTVEDRADKRPQVTDVPQSQEIEPYADTIMFIHRDEVCANSDDNLNKERAEIIVAKQRNGRTGTIELA